MSIDDSSNPSHSSSRPPLLSQLDTPPPSVPVQVEFGARSQRGPQRSINDDHYLIVRLTRRHDTLRTSLPDDEVPSGFEEFAYAMVVADGIGGAGETASRLAITTLSQLSIYFGRWDVRIDETIAEQVMARAQGFYKGVD